MTQHVLLISLGPVQEFIASARRCRDLWFGSWVLSELAKAAAAGIVDELGTDSAALEALVFPAAETRSALDEGSAMSVANKLVVRVAGDGARAHAAAERGRERMLARLEALREEAFARVGKGDPRRERHFLIEVAKHQVDELFEYLWVAVIEGEGEAGYADARAAADQLLQARKNVRTWKQPTLWACEGVPKSSVDGVRESVLREDLYDRAVTGPRRAPALPAEHRRTSYGVHGAERLCGVGLLKRWGVQLDRAGRRRIERFFSTAHVAALPLLLGIDSDARRKPALATAWQSLRKAAGPAAEELDVVPGRGTDLFGRTDGAILFPQRLSEIFVDCGFPVDSDKAKAALRELKSFRDLAGRGDPLPYYAILVADGDSMGEIIKQKTSPSEHRNLSKALDSFAGSAGDIVEEHDGRLIYSGGDDVLAFLPLHKAIECAHALAKRFAKLPNATLSAGIAIVHYLDPMGAALNVARAAEKRAKSLPGKNALAVTLDKRSGGTTTVCDHWEPLAPRLLDLCELHTADAIPDKAGHELADLARLGKELGAIQRSEAIRILGRKRAKRGKETIAAATLERLKAHLGEDVAELGRELAIAALIAQAKGQAAPSAEEGV